MFKIGKYEHFKGGQYEVLGVAKHSDTLEELVVYKSSEGDLWARPIKMFLEKVEFKGKKGVQHKIALQSKKLARLVKQCRDIPGKELFQFYNAEGKHCAISSGDINQYLHEITGEDFTAKDFRTWAGSVSALYAIKNAGEFETVTECKKKIISVLDEVAINLGNTRAVCKKYYVHPTVIKSYEEGTIFRYIRALDEDKNISPSELNKAELALLEIVQNEKLAEAS